jgi:hypothetical protein
VPDRWIYTAAQWNLAGPLRKELDAVLAEHGARYHVVGPCCDGGWYAWPRGRDEVPRVLAASLAELAEKLDELGSSS